MWDFLVVFLLLSVACLADQSVCPPGSLMCGSTCFDPRQSLCCGESPIPKGSRMKCCNGVALATEGNEDLQCCGAGLYNWRTSRCCPWGGIIPLNYECCRNAPNGYINGREEICCDGKPIRYNSTQDVNACCGDTGYNKNTKKCCKGAGKSTLLAMDDAYNHGKCCVRRNGAYGAVIRVQPYDDRRHVCCGGTVIKFTKQCCGNVALQDDQLCCSGVAIYKDDRNSNACCFRPFTNTYHTYNSQLQYCDRGGSIHSRHSNEEHIRQLQQEFFACGRLTYNITTNICCRGILYERQGSTTACCGLRAYNTQEDLCCKGRLRKGKNKDHFICCGRTATPKSQGCPNRRTRRPTDDCSRQSYDPSRQRCCDGLVRRYSSRHEKCCGWDIYNERTQKCCRGHFILAKRKSCRRRSHSRHHRRT